MPPAESQAAAFPRFFRLFLVCCFSRICSLLYLTCFRCQTSSSISSSKASSSSSASSSLSESLILASDWLRNMSFSSYLSSSSILFRSLGSSSKLCVRLRSFDTLSSHCWSTSSTVSSLISRVFSFSSLMEISFSPKWSMPAFMSISILAMRSNLPRFRSNFSVASASRASWSSMTCLRFAVPQNFSSSTCKRILRLSSVNLSMVA
mmetsp:Transcript_15807/g.40181  ORF Transcript_15807/g.40181 Transcript_15807/m.40181 type:complete len:206 (+) Transcript_15807:269-886(+)